jgi:hypothetical protein
MTLQLSLAPDVGLDRLPAWFYCTVRLQHTLRTAIHISPARDDAEQQLRVSQRHADLVHAGAALAAHLAREYGYRPLVRAIGVFDEAVLFARAGGPTRVRDLAGDAAGDPDHAGPVTLALPPVPDLHALARLLLEPAGLPPEGLVTHWCRRECLVARRVLRGESLLGVLPERRFHALPEAERGPLVPLTRSRIQALYHPILIAPDLAEARESLATAFISLAVDSQGRAGLAGLGAPLGFEPLGEEDLAFMGDLMDGLLFLPDAAGGAVWI